jgi:hypothetical protein
MDADTAKKEKPTSHPTKKNKTPDPFEIRGFARVSTFLEGFS